MVKISGKYQHIDNFNFVKHLTCHGMPENRARIYDTMHPILEIELKDDKLELLSNSGVDKASSVLYLNREVIEPLPNDIFYKSSVTLEEDTLTIISSSADGKQSGGRRVLKFSEDQLILTMISDNPDIPTAVRTYKRI